MKPRICWITATYMLQVDFPILPQINKIFDIDWYVEGKKDSRSIEVAEKYAKDNNIKVNVISNKRHSFHPFSFFEYLRNIKRIRQNNYDLYYLDISLFPWLYWAIKLCLPSQKIVVAMHHGKIHSGMRFKFAYRPFLKLLNRESFNLQYFSKTQAESFKGKDIKRKFVIPLALNDFGMSNVKPPKDKVVFTTFGNIMETKNIQLLIAAANKLYELYPGKFIVKIVGHCKSWKAKYSSLIKYPQAFELDIRRIEESEIPKLFGETHYLVLPYKAVTQSGPLRIAYGYNVPVIASNLDGFRESVENGITGILFESESIQSLVNVMKNAVEFHPKVYIDLKKTQKNYVDANLSVDSICTQYVNMLERINNEFKEIN